jgi:hypothetical protein
VVSVSCSRNDNERGCRCVPIPGHLKYFVRTRQLPLMRPDEGGCADLRRSRTAPLKVVRSPAYARPSPTRVHLLRAGVRRAPRDAGGNSPRPGRATAPGSACGTAKTLPAGPRAARTAPPPALGRRAEAAGKGRTGPHSLWTHVGAGGYLAYEYARAARVPRHRGQRQLPADWGAHP